MNVRIAWVVLIPFLVAADSPKDEAAKKDLQAMQGNWTLLSYIVKGKATAPADLAKIELTVQGNVSTFKKDKQNSHGTYVLDPTKKPKTIDIDLTDGPDKGKKMLGIYVLEPADQMKICVAEVGAPRPTEFKSSP